MRKLDVSAMKGRKLVIHNSSPGRVLAHQMEFRVKFPVKIIFQN